MDGIEYISESKEGDLLGNLFSQQNRFFFRTYYLSSTQMPMPQKSSTHRQTWLENITMAIY